MTLQIRRVVTGHDQNGRAIVSVDEICKNVISRRPRHESCVIWSTGSFPSDNATPLDGGTRAVASTDPNGSVFRIVEYAPGVAPRNHRTESIDYAVVMAGVATTAYPARPKAAAMPAPMPWEAPVTIATFMRPGTSRRSRRPADGRPPRRRRPC